MRVPLFATELFETPNDSTPTHAHTPKCAAASGVRDEADCVVAEAQGGIAHVGFFLFDIKRIGTAFKFNRRFS
jgi:hypothetical protein